MNFIVTITGHKGTDAGTVVAMKYIQNSNNSRLIDADLIGRVLHDTRLKTLTTLRSTISTVSFSSSGKPTFFNGWNCLSEATFNNSNISIFMGARGPELSSSADTSPTPTSPSDTVFLMPPVSVAALPHHILPWGNTSVHVSSQHEDTNIVSIEDAVDAVDANFKFPIRINPSPAQENESLDTENKSEDEMVLQATLRGSSWKLHFHKHKSAKTSVSDKPSPSESKTKAER